MTRRGRLPVPGQRILRSVIAVWLCFAVYLLRGRHGIPLYSALAVLQAMQPTTRAMRPVVRKRLIGTLIGAAWGLLLLLIELRLISDGVPDELLHYVLVGLFTGIVLYSTVLMKLTEAAYFSTVVFLVITINHIGDANPYVYAFNRLLDTAIGLGLAEIVNRARLPRLRNTDILFASEIEGTLLDGHGVLPPFSRIELNHLLADGAKFTLATTETQATVRELLPGVELRWPVVTMDGAALYDMQSMKYLRTVPMERETAERLIGWAQENELPFFANGVRDDLLIVHISELTNDAIRELYERKRRSPYRNFVRGQADRFEDIIYLLTLDRTEKLEAACARLEAEPWAAGLRLVRSKSAFEGYTTLKIYDKNSSREAMLRELEKLLEARETVTFGPAGSGADVEITSPEKDQAARELSRRYEPVSLKGWRNMFRR